MTIPAPTPPPDHPAPVVVTDASGRVRAHLDPDIPFQNSPLRQALHRAGLLGPLPLTPPAHTDDETQED